MYPSHLIHMNHTQTNHIEGRTYPSHSSFELFRVVSRNNEGQFNQRKDFLLQSHSAINLPHSTAKHVQNSHSSAKTYYHKREYWNSRNQGKSKRLQHGNSAPCLITAVTDESGDSGISRSPTPSKQQQPASCHLNGRIEPLNPLNLWDKDCSCESQVGFASGQASNRVMVQKRDVQLQPKRRTNYNNRNQGTFFRNRRPSSHNVILHYPTPYPPSALFTPYYTAPDRFFLRSHLMQVTQVPNELLNGSSWDQLSQSTWTKFLVNQQTQNTFEKKMGLWKYLYVYIKQYFPKYGLYLVGSTMNGFGSDYSDVDMCLLIRYAEVDQRNEAVSYLNNILKLLERCEFVEKLELIQAKVPLLKFRDSKQGLQVDLNCNNSVGIRNTHLLYCYGQLDWRVKPLVLVVKLWAQWHNINDAKNMTISSYSLALMVIHFLQCGVNPRVLPCLHSLYSEKFNPDIDIGSIDIQEELEPFISENKQPLGELLLQFYQYYAGFDFLKYAISVRLASVIPVEECRHVRSLKNDPHQWKFLCIEEPFDLTNTARSVYDPDKFDHIRSVILRTAQSLMKTKKFESMFNLEAS